MKRLPVDQTIIELSAVIDLYCNVIGEDATLTLFTNKKFREILRIVKMQQV